MLIVRVVIGLGLLALGYYVGREVGRAEPTRRELEARAVRHGAGQVPDVASGQTKNDRRRIQE